MRLSFFTSVVVFAAACGDEPPAPKSEPSSRPTTPIASASATPSAAPAPSASAVAPAPSASAEPATSASGAPSAALVPAEKPSPTRPGEGEFAAVEKEIMVKASGEQKCSTKVLTGWFEMICPEAEGLVRATKVDVESGFDKDSVLLEGDDSKAMRFTAQLPASGELSRARFWGKGLHEIFLTLEHTDKGWKGQLSGKRPTP
jgi:hypothetical protein